VIIRPSWSNFLYSCVPNKTSKCLFWGESSHFYKYWKLYR